MAHTNPIHPSRTADSEPTRTTATGTVGDLGTGTPQTMRNGRKAVLHIYNADSSNAMSVRFITHKTIHGLDLENPERTIPGGEDHVFGPFDPDVYDNESGNVEFYIYGTEIAIGDASFASYYLP